MSEMQDPTITLKQQIAVKPQGPDSYISVIKPTRMGELSATVFGGNILAIAVNAAYQTISTTHHLYSISGHFIRPATTDRNLICKVQRIRNTRTFETRHLQVIQKAADGSAVLCLIASADFHIEEPRSMVVYAIPPRSGPQISHYEPLRHDPVPERHVLYRYIERFTDVQSISIGGNEEETPATSRISGEKFRVKGPLETEAENMSALAFYLDKGLAYIPANHNGYELSEASACATLDFSLRIFTHKLNLENWHTIEQQTIAAENARAFSEGRVWNDSGHLIASMTQQTILRPRADFQSRI
ncbi:uncharacterized protein TRUGW13939_05881 [Talaromyces rugulosus]|uniref:Acyl-CoA thioesterase II n=1 Tax=Talaromyces rugulosus TaxID=121627 RepID=A0A7H8QXB8_TALRU|nr:uncharacterized protein TRUGW13939_05881 [Talaromyces rugulosus]QKX58754.1 hypothetical protein TRUGW13939_05881 [Talaromyces rugulosus]